MTSGPESCLGFTVTFCENVDLCGIGDYNNNTNIF